MELSDKLPASVANPQEETRYPFSRRLRGLEPVSMMSRREKYLSCVGIWTVERSVRDPSHCNGWNIPGSWRNTSKILIKKKLWDRDHLVICVCVCVRTLWYDLWLRTGSGILRQFEWRNESVGIFNHLNAELNPIRHLLALVGARHFVHVSGARVKEFNSLAALLPEIHTVSCSKGTLFPRVLSLRSDFDLPAPNAISVGRSAPLHPLACCWTAFSIIFTVTNQERPSTLNEIRRKLDTDLLIFDMITGQICVYAVCMTGLLFPT